MERNNGKVLLVIEKNPSGSIGLKKAKELGLYIIYMGSNKYSNKLSSEDYNNIDENIIVNTNDQIEVINRCLEINKRIHIDGVMTFMEYYVPLVANVAKELNLPGNSPESALKAHNKLLMRDAFFKFGTPCPKYQKFTDINGALEVAEKIGYPNVMKPINMAASRFVMKNNNDEELLEHYKLLSIAQPPYGVQKESTYLLEEFMDGQEISVEAVTIDGRTQIIAITKKLVGGDHAFVELGHTVPYDIDTSVKKEIYNVVYSGIMALGLTHGLTHNEVKLTKEGPKIVEIAGRLGGDRIPELVELSLGTDLWKASIQLAIGEIPDLKPTKNMSASIRFLTATPGVVNSISGIEQAKRSEGVYDVVIEAEIGHSVNKLENSLDRVGEIIAIGSSMLQSENNALTSLEKIKIETK